jgi:AraC-like DNA-binding protein
VECAGCKNKLLRTGKRIRMSIENVPDIYIGNPIHDLELFLYDFKMTEDVIKTKVNLNMHMFSFLRVGKKKVHFSDVAIEVNKDQSLLLKRGNCLWTELLDTEAIYYCRLLFFSDKVLKDFLRKHNINPVIDSESPYFTIYNDAFIATYLDSLSSFISVKNAFSENMLAIKFEELMLYLINKYGRVFEAYINSLVSSKISLFQNTVEKNIYSSLNLEEIAFLCNMSLSTFKRKFIQVYNVSPGKWLRHKRLTKAREILKLGKLKPSDIYSNLGYNNLSNFSIAFKNKFGINPKDVYI